LNRVDALLAALALVAGGLAARATWRATGIPSIWRSVITLIAALGAIVGVLAVAALWLDQPDDPWNACRVAPVVAARLGFKLYQPLETGPVLSTVVGPVAFLAYWPLGWLRSSPTGLILAGSAANLLAFALLGRALLRRIPAAPGARALAGITALQLVLLSPALRYSIFCIHADAPSLALGTFGVVILVGATPKLTWLRAAGAALCFTLAVWAKQSLAPIFAAAVLALALRDGWRPAARFVVVSGVVGSLISAALVAWLGFATLRLNMLDVPAHHPWLQMSLTSGQIYPALSAIGALARAKVLLAAVLNIVRSAWPLYALFIALLARHATVRSMPGRWWPRTAWGLLFLVSVVLLPTAALGRVKLGGEVNHESFSLLFLVLAFVCWLAERAPPVPTDPATADRLQLVGAAGVVAVLLLLTIPRILDYRGWTDACLNQNEIAFRYDRAHPGRVYFPWNPLTSLLAEGRAFHADYAVFDRNLGGARVTPDHLTRGMPASRPLIASFIAHHDYILHTYFPDYVLRPADPELPGWKIYGPPPGPDRP
jgi:hypothetical protein